MPNFVFFIINIVNSMTIFQNLNVMKEIIYISLVQYFNDFHTHSMIVSYFHSNMEWFSFLKNCHYIENTHFGGLYYEHFLKL